MAALPQRPLPAAALVKPAAAGDVPAQWIVIGPRVREQLAPQLERLMPLVWLALMETSGVPEGQGYRLVIDAAHLEPVPNAS